MEGPWWAQQRDYFFIGRFNPPIMRCRCGKYVDLQHYAISASGLIENFYHNKCGWGTNLRLIGWKGDKRAHGEG
jgi:hypothetical protein